MNELVLQTCLKLCIISGLEKVFFYIHKDGAMLTSHGLLNTIDLLSISPISALLNTFGGRIHQS